MPPKRVREHSPTEHLFELISLGCENIDETMDFFKDHLGHIDFNHVEEGLGNSILLQTISMYSVCADTSEIIWQKINDFLNLLIDSDTRHVMTGKPNDMDDVPLEYLAFFIRNPGYTNIVLKLLETGHSNPSVQESENADTPLILLCSSIKNFKGTFSLLHQMNGIIMKLVQILAREAPNSIGFVNFMGNTALTTLLDTYVMQPNIKSVITSIALTLIDTGHSNPGEVVPEISRTALMYAIENGFIEVALKLVNTPGSNIAFVSDSYQTALDFITSDLLGLREDEVTLLVRILQYYFINDPSDPAFVRNVGYICQNEIFLRERLQHRPELQGFDIIAYCSEPVETSAIYTRNVPPRRPHQGFYEDRHRTPRYFVRPTVRNVGLRSETQENSSVPLQAEPIRTRIMGPEDAENIPMEVEEENITRNRIWDPRHQQWFTVQQNNSFLNERTGELLYLGENPGPMGRVQRLIRDEENNQLYNPDQLVDPDEFGTRIPQGKDARGGKKRKTKYRKEHNEKKAKRKTRKPRKVKSTIKRIYFSKKLKRTSTIKRM
jgi:hypothetical protein